MDHSFNSVFWIQICNMQKVYLIIHVPNGEMLLEGSVQANNTKSMLRK